MVSVGIPLNSPMRNFEVVGYDPSAFYIRYANTMYENQKHIKKVNVEFVCGHPLRLSTFYSGHKFDVAILMGCLGFIDDEFDISILKSVVSMLKKGLFMIL